MAFAFPFFSAKRALGWTVVDAQGGLLGVTVDTTGAKPRVRMHAQRTSPRPPTSADWQQLANELGGFKFPVLALLGRSEYQIFWVDKATVRPKLQRPDSHW